MSRSFQCAILAGKYLSPHTTSVGAITYIPYWTASRCYQSSRTELSGGIPAIPIGVGKIPCFARTDASEERHIIVLASVSTKVNL